MELLMPFQSEKQRKYLWANEPKIAREWTDKYGSRVKKSLGGNTERKIARNIYNKPEYDQMAKVFNTPESLMSIGAVEPGSAWGYNLTDQGEVLEDFRNSATKMRAAKQSPTYQQGIQSQFKRMLGMPGLAGDVIENKDFIQNAIDKGFLQDKSDWENQKSFENPDDLEASLNDLSNNRYASNPNYYSDANYVNDINSGIGSYPQSQDLEAQPSGMFEEEDEDGNFIDRMRKYTMPAYNFMRGNIGAGLMGVMNPLAGLAMFAGGRKNSNAYRGATGSAGGYNAAQLNKMNALGGYYTEPARNQRRTQSRIDNMMARKAAGKSYSQKNLANLSTQISGDGGNNNGGNQGGGGGFGKGNDPGGGAAGSPFNRGGLASLWQR